MFGKAALGLILVFAPLSVTVEGEVLPPMPQEAKEAAPPAAPPATLDFAVGFQKLIALGLPSLEGAEWIAVADVRAMPNDYELREIVSASKGSGWRIQQNGKPMLLGMGALEAIEMPESGSSGGSLLGALLGGGSKKPKASDLTADATKITEALLDPRKSGELRSQMEYRGTGSLGSLLIFAAQLHQTGHPAEANKLATAVFSFGNPEKVIDGAVNRIAANALNRVTTAFFTNHDWATYERELRALTERFPRGWDSLPAVQMLLPAVGKRVAGTKPPTLSIPGVTIPPEALAALDDTLKAEKGAPDEDALKRFALENEIPEEMLKNPQYRQQILRMLASGGDEGSRGGLWLIEKPPGTEAKDPWSRLKRMGVDALPALAAVAADDTLTLSRNNQGRGDSFSFSSNRESAADLALKEYRSMDRPVTRGELAMRLLSSALPSEGERGEEATPEALAQQAVEFWKANRGKSRLDLIKVFLAQGDDSQKAYAATLLSELPEEGARKAFEKHILETDDVTPLLESVSAYLKLHKGAAKDFFAKFSERLKSQLDGADLDRISSGYQIRSAGGVDKYLKKLSLFVGGESPRKLVLELAKAEKPDVQQIHSLGEALTAISPEEYISSFIEAAAAATSLETRAAMVQMLQRGGSSRGARGTSVEQQARSEGSGIPAALIQHWKVLMTDERKFPDGVTAKLHIAIAMEVLYSSSSMQKLGEVYQLDRAAYGQLLNTRAQDRIAGKPPTGFPDAGKVPAARMEELIKQLAAAKPEAIASLVDTWTLDEKFAYAKWRATAANRDKIPPSAIAARKLLNSSKSITGEPPSAKSLELLNALQLKPGTKLDADTLIATAGSLVAAGKARSGTSCTLAGSPLDTGFNATVVNALEKSEAKDQMALYSLYSLSNELRDPKEECVVVLSWASENQRSTDDKIVWKLSGSTVTPPDAEALKKFRDAMAALDLSDAKPLTLSLNALHRDDTTNVMKAIQSSSDDSEDSDE